MKRCLQRGLRGLYREPEGWLALPTGYDDGGVSGATLERPALQPRNRQHDCPRSKVLIRDNARLSEIREMPTWVLQRAPANRGGYAELVAWARTLGAVETFGIEGTGSYGVGLASFVRRHAVRVVEVNHCDRRKRRNNGKSGTIDAEAEQRTRYPRSKVVPGYSGT